MQPSRFGNQTSAEATKEGGAKDEVEDELDAERFISVAANDNQSFRRISHQRPGNTGTHRNESLSEQETRIRLQQKKIIKWDEPAISVHMQERGVEYGTMNVGEPDTPFVHLDSRDESSMKVFKGGKVDSKVAIDELQQKLHAWRDEVQAKEAAEEGSK